VLKDVKSRLYDREIVELFSYCVWPGSGRIEDVLGEYKSRDVLHLYGYFEEYEDEGEEGENKEEAAEQEQELVGIIGFEMSGKSDLMIRHLAVKPEFRGLGYGRGLILEAVDLMKPEKVVAETDDDAVDFFRWIGFEIESLGESFPGVERYRCTFLT